VNERFAGKVAVVTGAGSGIGRAITRRFVDEGGSVVGGDIEEPALSSLAAELTGRVFTARCDVTSEAEVASLVSAAGDRFGRLDAMFNVAGGSRPGLIVDLTEADWDFTVDLCLKGVFFGTKHAARHMVAAERRGTIVNIASLNSEVPMFFGSAYSAAKAGVASLGASAALELAEHGIRVATVSPGLTDTPLIAPMMQLPGVEAAFMERIPLRRPAAPDDVAAAALFLASDDAGYITGVNLFVDGGWAHTAYPDLRRFVAPLVAEPEGTARSMGVLSEATARAAAAIDHLGDETSSSDR
jgi:NAD(P)-dependent dehydrogenase (short-subunit alcohol dehydrogenase family)